MEIIDKKAIDRMLLPIKGIEIRANEFLTELYENGNFSNKEILGFIENPKLVYDRIIDIGRKSAEQFQIGSQKELLSKQALISAEKLEQLAKDIFNLSYTELKFVDVKNAINIKDGKADINRDKVKATITEKHTVKPSKQSLAMIDTLNALCNEINQANELIQVNGNKVSKLQFQRPHALLNGGMNAFREHMPYKVIALEVIRLIK